MTGIGIGAKRNDEGGEVSLRRAHRARKVPVVMQMEALECGAACLSMILAYYGKWLPLEQVRSACDISRDGSRARNILVAARSFGLDAAGFTLDIDDLKDVGGPCILF